LGGIGGESVFAKDMQAETVEVMEEKFQVIIVFTSKQAAIDAFDS
tara:strand:- start:207 stop:341 length:135 start_codon:yes stop_codon:yes gene_type:complete